MASGKNCHSPWHLLYCLKSSSGHLFLSLTSFPTLFPSLFYQDLATLVLLQFLELPSTSMFPAQGLRPCHSLCLECSSPKYQHGLFFTAFKWLLKYHLLRCYFAVNQILYSVFFRAFANWYYIRQLLIYDLSLGKQKFCLLCSFTTMSLMPRTVLTHSRWNLCDCLIKVNFLI